MPYYPPADLPPPPIVQTVQSSKVSDAITQPPGTALSGDGRSLPETTPSGHPSLSVHPVDAPPPRIWLSSGTALESPKSAIARDSNQSASRLAETAERSRDEAGASTSAPKTPATASGNAGPVHLRRVSMPWVSQSTVPVPPQPGLESVEDNSPAPTNDGIDPPSTDDDSPDDEGEARPETEDDSDSPAIVYPRAATPEPNWANGAVLNDGTLLPPTQPTAAPTAPLNLTADYQEFEPQTQVLTARGNVVLRLGSGVLSADRLWANLANRFVLAEGNVIFTRGEQTVEADRVEYNLVQGEGTLFDARGTLFLPTTGTDLAGFVQPGETSNPGILETDPITNVQGTGSITFGTGVTIPSSTTGLPLPAVGGFVRRIRFEAERLDFDSEGWYAEDISFTNDPFSPPELEFRGNRATLTRINEVQDELFVENARVVFDQSLTIPLLRNTVILNRGGPDSANPLFVTIGFDGDDRDGLFIERSFQVFQSGTWEVFLSPQFLAQRFVGGEEEPQEEESFLSNFGLEADVFGTLGPRTLVSATASFSGLDLSNLEERLRSSVRVEQLVGDHSLNLEYSYRDRLFNGSLGFQDVQSSLGAVLVSPNITLGNTGIVLNYQASAQYITANTDRLELVDATTPPFRASLGRFQGSVGVSRSFVLWRGEALPPTADEGLRFTSTPRLPFVQLVLAGRGTYTYYTSDDTQQDLSGIVGLTGEFGNFSDDFFDSTVFNVFYSRSFVGEGSSSPFLFDRNVDQNTLSGGIIQQIYGPFRLGFQTSVNLDTGEVINTDYVFEYNRRTYGIFLRFNPTQQAGFLGFRLNEFDWAGRAPRFGGADIREVNRGVVRPD